MIMETLSEHFEDEMASIPAASGSLQLVRRRARRRRVTRAVASGATTLVVLVVVVSLLVPSLPRIATADGPGAPTRLLIDGDVEIPVTDEPIASVENVARALTVYGGLPAPAAAFDLSSLGTEQELSQNDPAWDPTTDPGDVPVVYIGDVAGRSVFLHTNGAISTFDRVLHEIIDGQSFGPHLCISVGDTAVTGGGGFCTGPASIPEGRSTSGFLTVNGVYIGDYVTWFGLPADTAVVVIEFEDGEALWQIPSGETVLFDLGGPRPGTTSLKAIDPDGQVLYQMDLAVHDYVTSTGTEEDVEIAPPAND